MCSHWYIRLRNRRTLNPLRRTKNSLSLPFGFLQLEGPSPPKPQTSNSYVTTSFGGGLTRMGVGPPQATHSSPSWEADRCLRGQNIYQLYWYRKVHCRLHSSPPPEPDESNLQPRNTPLQQSSSPPWEPQISHSVKPGVQQCGSCNALLMMLGFKNKIFYFIYVHKCKLLFPYCLISSIFIFVFTFLDRTTTLKRHLQKEWLHEYDMDLADFFLLKCGSRSWSSWPPLD
jgi:hypothetical protein